MQLNHFRCNLPENKAKCNEIKNKSRGRHAVEQMSAQLSCVLQISKQLHVGAHSARCLAALPWPLCHWLFILRAGKGFCVV